MSSVNGADGTNGKNRANSCQTTKLVIKEKGLGLTQALFDMVKKNEMEISNGKISKEEWNATTENLAELQERQQTKGKKSIFSGGTDKNDYRKSFVVPQNLEVKFTESEELYKAMGVKTKGTPQPPKPQVADGKPPVADSKPPVAKSKPPVADSKPPVALDISTVQTLANPTGIKNQTVRNPETGESITYDEKGFITTVHDANGKKTREILREADGSVDRSVDYEYDADGKETRTIFRMANGRVKFYAVNEYDSNGKKTREILHNADGSVYVYSDYEYDSNGKKTREITHDADGSVRGYRDYEYDSNGNCTRKIEREADGSVYQYYDYEYDSNGKMIREIWRNVDGEEILNISR